MSLARGIVTSLVALAACSRPQPEPQRPVDEPWSHAYVGPAGGWWTGWSESLQGEAPFGPGTEFELETLGPHGIRMTEVLEVISLRPDGPKSFWVRVRSSNGHVYNTPMPPALAYTRTNPGVLTTRNERLIPVTTPAGTFPAGRLWSSEAVGTISYERDEWVVPDLPVRVQTWLRPVSAEDLYNPPADETIPEGTVLTRLVRITRR